MDRLAEMTAIDGVSDARFQESETAQSAAHRLLVIDDNEAVLEIIQDILILKGYKVVAVGDGKKALEIIEEEDFDLVVTDLGLPSISGWEIARKVKSKNPKLPVVLLTGWGPPYEDEDLKNEGIDLVLSKPLSWEKLTENIRTLLWYADLRA